MSRSLNKVLLIGNLTKEPEIKYSSKNIASCNLNVATNRKWTTENGESKEEVEYHKVVVWGKLAEIYGQMLKKGKKVYVEGRLHTQSWTDKDGVNRKTIEIVADDIIVLSPKSASLESFSTPEPEEIEGEEETKKENLKLEERFRIYPNQLDDYTPF